MSKKTDWGKVVRDTVNDVICAIKNSPKLPSTPNPRAHICVLVLMILTLLLSGISFYSWLIIIMLFIILQFI